MDIDEVHFGHIKLAVDDIDRCAAFYREVCGLVELGRADATMNGRAGTEVMFAPTAEGGPMLILVKFHDVSAPRSTDVLLGFRTTDLVAFCARVDAAGGRVTQDIRSIPEHGVEVAFAADVEGNVLEVLQLLPASPADGNHRTSSASSRGTLEER
ncbi:VOC family protein [Streptodolium elevatio]